MGMYMATLFQPEISLVENLMCFDENMAALRYSRHLLCHYSKDSFIVIYQPNGQLWKYIYWCEHEIHHSIYLPDRLERFGQKTDWINEGF